MSAYTTVINTSGGRKHFSFLPPHGLTLDELECITFIGELHNRLIPGWPYHSDKDRQPNKTKLKALEKAEKEGQLLIIRSISEPERHGELTKAFRRVDNLGMSDPNFNSNIVKG